MRTSLNEIRKIENYLDGKLNSEESIAFQTELFTNAVLKLNVYVQQKVYSILRLYHRKKLKEEIENVHRRIFEDEKNVVFQQSIFQLLKH